MTAEQPCVVAGVSRHAPAHEHVVDWAADEAAARSIRLRLVHALDWPSRTPSVPEPGHPAHFWATHQRAVGDSVLRDARSAALARHPGTDVETELVLGRPVRALREEAQSASLVVLGTRLLTGVEAAFAGGGKGEALAGHLPCPLALVPEPPGDLPPDAPVVVGVDGSPASEAAIAIGFEQAAKEKAGLVAVQVCKPRDPSWPDFPRGAELSVSESIAGHRARYPDVEVRFETPVGSPAVTLSSAARYARCLVVGTRGRGGFRGMLLGSTSRSLVHHTPCPLVIVPASGRH